MESGLCNRSRWCRFILLHHRTCQVDPTCVQCDTCFKNSDHTGHEVRPTPVLSAFSSQPAPLYAVSLKFRTDVGRWRLYSFSLPS